MIRILEKRVKDLLDKYEGDSIVPKAIYVPLKFINKNYAKNPTKLVLMNGDLMPIRMENNFYEFEYYLPGILGEEIVNARTS